jgi:hypothetical protein
MTEIVIHHFSLFLKVDNSFHFFLADSNFLNFNPGQSHKTNKRGICPGAFKTFWSGWIGLEQVGMSLTKSLSREPTKLINENAR